MITKTLAVILSVSGLSAIVWVETEVSFDLLWKVIVIVFFAGGFYFTTIGAIKRLDKRLGGLERLLLMTMGKKPVKTKPSEVVELLLEGAEVED